MIERKKLTSSTTIEELVFLVSENNGFAEVLLQRLKRRIGCEASFKLFLINLCDMNIRGAQIAHSYLECCNRDLNVFIEAVNKRDEEMVKLVNQIVKTNIACVGNSELGLNS